MGGGVGVAHLVSCPVLRRFTKTLYSIGFAAFQHHPAMVNTGHRFLRRIGLKVVKLRVNPVKNRQIYVKSVVFNEKQQSQ